MTNSTSKPGKSALQSGVNYVAIVGGGLVAFLATGPAFHLTHGAILAYAKSEYGPGWEGLLTPLWWLAVAVATFGLAQALVAISLRLAVAKLSARLFG